MSKMCNELRPSFLGCIFSGVISGLFVCLNVTTNVDYQ